MTGSWSRLPPNLTREPLLTVSVPTIVSPRHPLATHPAPVPKAVLAEHIHVISMSTIYRTDSPPGPTGRWFIERLEDAIRVPHAIAGQNSPAPQNSNEFKRAIGSASLRRSSSNPALKDTMASSSSDLMALNRSRKSLCS